MTQAIWLQAQPDEIALLRELLAGRDDPVAQGLVGKIDILTSGTQNDPAFRDAAVEKYSLQLQDGDLDFQHDGLVSHGDEGAYVMAFLWVSHDDVGLAGPGEEDPDEDAGPSGLTG